MAAKSSSQSSKNGLQSVNECFNKTGEGMGDNEVILKKLIKNDSY